AFYKAQEAAGTRLPLEGSVLISVNKKDKPQVVELARSFREDGFKIYATRNTYKALQEEGIEAERVLKVYEGRPNILDMITNGKFDVIVNSPSGDESVHDDSYVRKAAIKARIPYMTTIAAAKAAAEGIHYLKGHEQSETMSLQALHAQIKDK
ncbi:MAG: carbamoyl phosphate synthase large subunit, partial [Lachnospiraceae bacterium]|nr:carbamoyl phosphate synthase large subunit [Lachnospiraceae bacterium]